MENLEVKCFIGSTPKKWSKITIDSAEYVVKYDTNQDGQDVSTLKSITCWLSDFESIWLEKVAYDEINDRLKRCNPLLACNKMLTRIMTTITSLPQDGNNVQLTGLNENDCLHLNTKYYLSDGSDPIPLKFYWTLEKGASHSIYQIFSEMLTKIADLEKANEVLKETIRSKDEILNKLAMNEIVTVQGQEEEEEEHPKSDDKESDESNGESVDHDSGVFHEGITCDHCGTDVYGHRYKCIECEDFDLCQACEHKEKQHTHHLMVRLGQPEEQMRLEQALRAFNKGRTSFKGSKRTRNT